MSTTSLHDSSRPLCVPYDTTFEAARVQFAAIRRMTLEERLERGCRINDEFRALLKAGVRHRHPEYDDEQVRIATVRLLIGEELFHECFPGCDVRP
jgi:hypothetical protein